MEDNKIWRVENMESVHDESEIDESKTDEIDESETDENDDNEDDE